MEIEICTGGPIGGGLVVDWGDKIGAGSVVTAACDAAVVWFREVCCAGVGPSVEEWDGAGWGIDEGG